MRADRKSGVSRRFSMWLILAILFTMITGMSFPVLAGEDIVVLYTNDVHCGVDDYIGYAGLALYKKEMQEKTPYVTLVDAGDAIQGASIGTLSEGGYIVDIMNEVGYDFAVPGNHEFDYGMERFFELADRLDCGYYSGNFTDLRTGNLVFAPYKIFDYGGKKIAYVGVTTPESFTKSTPAYFQDTEGHYIYSFGEGENGETLYRQVQAAVDSARKEGAEYVIMVAHLGENGSTKFWSSDTVIANTSGIDVCIDGHSHETYDKYVRNQDGQQVLLTQTGTKLSNIGKLTITPDGTIKSEQVSHVTAWETGSHYIVKKGDTLQRIAKRELGSYNRWQEIYDSNRDQLCGPDMLEVGAQLVIPMVSAVDENGRAVDYSIHKYIKDIQAQYEESLKTVIGHSDVELTINNPVAGTRAIRNAETNLGDLTADAYRYVMGADIGLSNGGGIRSGIAAGDITYQNALSVFPFGNMICLVEATGQQVKDALEMGAKACPEESGGFLQVSGLRYTIDTSVNSSVSLDDKGNFALVSGAYRVRDILVNGEPLDVNKTYTVASHSYLLKSGGDGMNMFQGCRLLRDEVISDMEVLSAYIQDNLGGNVGAEYANMTGQGRITVLK